MPNKNSNDKQDGKIKVQFESVGGDKSLLILVDQEMTLKEIMDRLANSKFFPKDDYSGYALQNKRTSSYLHGATLQKSGVIDGDRIRIIPSIEAG